MIRCFLVWVSKASILPSLVLLLDGTALLCPLRVQSMCRLSLSQAVEQRRFPLSVSFRKVRLLWHHRTLKGWSAGWCSARFSSLITISRSGWSLHWSCPGQRTLLLSWRSHWSVVHPDLLVLALLQWGQILSVALSLTLENRSWSRWTDLPRIWTVHQDWFANRGHLWTDQGWSCGSCS